MERLTDRIYEIAIAELPRQSLGLHPLGVDVCWGVWNVSTPQGPAKAETLGMLFAFRPAGPGGEVLLGSTTPPITTVHTLSGLYPTEQEIKTGVETACNSARAFIQQQRAPQNGKSAGAQQLNNIVKDAWNRFQEGQGQ